LGLAYGLAGNKAEAQKVFAELQLKSKLQYVPPYFLATVAIGLGQKDKAIALLEKGYAERDAYLTWLKVEPALDPLRDQPSFQDLQRRVGLPQ
jgi:hypothetical protein